MPALSPEKRAERATNGDRFRATVAELEQRGVSRSELALELGIQRDLLYDRCQPGHPVTREALLAIWWLRARRCRPG